MKASDDFTDIRKQIQAFSTSVEIDRRRTLMSVEIRLQAGQRRLLNAGRKILVMDSGCVKTGKKEFGPGVFVLDGEIILAIEDSRMTVIYL